MEAYTYNHAQPHVVVIYYYVCPIYQGQSHSIKVKGYGCIALELLYYSCGISNLT